MRPRPHRGQKRGSAGRGPGSRGKSQIAAAPGSPVRGSSWIGPDAPSVRRNTGADARLFPASLTASPGLNPPPTGRSAENDSRTKFDKVSNRIDVHKRLHYRAERDGPAAFAGCLTAASLRVWSRVSVTLRPAPASGVASRTSLLRANPSIGSAIDRVI